MTRRDLIKLVAKMGVSQKEAKDIVDTLFSIIVEELSVGENVKIPKFGTFYVRDKRERVGFDFGRRKKVPISARRVVVFKASPVLKNMVNSGK